MDISITNLPEKYLPLWQKALPLFEGGRPGDAVHAKETVEMILGYRGALPIDKDILIPVAMLHDIGHVAILPEHFKYVTGNEKISNGKLVHMLTGAKIAKDILMSLNYDPKKIAEIIDIIAIHDADQLEGVDYEKMYDTENKRIFHDFDAMDRYTPERLKNVESLYPDRRKLLEKLESLLSNFFYDEFKQIARERLGKL